MKSKSQIFLCALISTFGLATAVAGSSCSEGMYRKAVRTKSNSPPYLLFTLHDAKTGKDRVVCTPSTGLLGAVHYEQHLDFDDDSRKKVIAIALSQPHRFTFTNPKAIHTIEPGYSEKTLGEYRSKLGKMSKSELVKALEAHELDKLYMIGPTSKWNGYEEAIAHVLLERGILVNQNDRTGGLFLD